mgnify:CR=1 FL=1
MISGLVSSLGTHDGTVVVTPCTAGTLSYVVWEDGRVNACEILPDTIGNVNNEVFPKNILDYDVCGGKSFLYPRTKVSFGKNLQELNKLFLI